MTKKEEFDLETHINEYPCPEMFKAGLRYYIAKNNIKIKSEKEFDKIFTEYGNISIGGK